MKDLLIHKTIPVTLYNNLLTFRGTSKKIEIQRCLLNMITNKNCNIDIAKSQVRKIMYDFAKERQFDIKAPGNKRTRDRSPKSSPKSPAIMASGNANFFTRPS